MVRSLFALTATLLLFAVPVPANAQCSNCDSAADGEVVDHALRSGDEAADCTYSGGEDEADGDEQADCNRDRAQEAAEGGSYEDIIAEQIEMSETAEGSGESVEGGAFEDMVENMENVEINPSAR